MSTSHPPGPCMLPYCPTLWLLRVVWNAHGKAFRLQRLRCSFAAGSHLIVSLDHVSLHWITIAIFNTTSFGHFMRITTTFLGQSFRSFWCWRNQSIGNATTPALYRTETVSVITRHRTKTIKSTKRHSTRSLSAQVHWSMPDDRVLESTPINITLWAPKVIMSSCRRFLSPDNRFCFCCSSTNTLSTPLGHFLHLKCSVCVAQNLQQVYYTTGRSDTVRLLLLPGQCTLCDCCCRWS